MFSTLSVSVQEFRGSRTQSTIGTSSFRDNQRMPVTKTNFKRAYLKGASNRVKFLKDESQFVSLCSDRKKNDKLFKFNRTDQLLNARNLHLQKLNPLPTSCPPNLSKIQSHSENHSPQQQNKQQSILLVQDQSHHTVEIIYQQQPVIKKLKKLQTKPWSSKTESYQNLIAAKLNTHISNNNSQNPANGTLSGLLITSGRGNFDIFTKSAQLTNYGSLQMISSETKINNSPQKTKIPTTLDKTKLYLKQFI